MSAGYTTQERVQRVELPKLGKSFLLLVGSTIKQGNGQWSASLLEIQASGLSDLRVGFSVALNGPMGGIESLDRIDTSLIKIDLILIEMSGL